MRVTATIVAAPTIDGVVVMQPQDVPLAALSQVTAGTLTLDEFFITQDFAATSLDQEVEFIARLTRAIIMSLSPSVPVTSLVIVNPLPSSVLRHRATHDGTHLIPRLRRVLNPLDAHLGRRLDGGGLQRVEFATERQGSVSPLASDEQPRVREFFPVLADQRAI
ncbi:hypothetical protein PsYK624_081110 [Phanerochaete sordida]|uniref:Uncharacterized protein n=1 Tax=Phanerochaete sordida TaxID=48140 RepID=A0A9P3LEU5_9APHY|nr:hypothetical protein PsYK624_081110 [Phanerochaete sordida]